MGELDQTGRPTQAQHLHEQVRQGREMALAEVGDGAEVGSVQARTSTRSSQARASWREEYRPRLYVTTLVRTGIDQEVDLSVTLTPLGAVARLEHALGGFATERAGHLRRLDDARGQAAAYRSREGSALAFAEELAAKRRELLELDATLAAADTDGDPRLTA